MIKPEPFLRSLLFVPGNDAKKIAGSFNTGADALIFDLEDSVDSTQKEASRSLVAAALRKESVPQRFVRVNDLSTGLTSADVAATILDEPDGYVLPKCEGPQDIERFSKIISVYEPARMPGILAIATETVRGVRNLMRQDWSHPALLGLAWGGEDLAADIGASRNRNDAGEYLSIFNLARDTALLAAREAGILAIDAVFVDFRDDTGMATEAGDAFMRGFDGKMAIHPAQIPIIHQAFTPTSAQVAWARRVIAALNVTGSGVAQLDGMMLDKPHLRAANRILLNADKNSPSV